jgi:hypothetical protein
MQRFVLLPLLFALLLGIGGCGGSDSGSSTTAQPPDSIRTAVEQKIIALNRMRESLAATIDTPAVDKSTFKRVCKPVGKRAKEIGRKNGWVVQQLAKKYRNPAHKLDAEAETLHEKFVNQPELTDTWIRTVRDNTEGWRYARRITVESSCLACHGPEEKRPAFVKKGYPDDRAYGFEDGDLRGLYSVFVPAPSADTLVSIRTPTRK